MRARVSIGDQSLDLFDEQGVRIRRYRVSTATHGAGELAGSQRTPRGHHIVRARVGAGQPRNAVFRARRPTGEIWTREAALAEPTRDWILSRILWLSGTEVGFNRLGNVDTMRRYIYIHGTPDTEPMGVPGSHGCIRMRNVDVIELFELLPAFSVVDIEE